MGVIWRSIMPLLSTLAALVIIVHSAEEEMERGYRRDLRPTPTDSHSYEQPWKAIDLDSLAQQPTRAETWIEIPDEEPPRRRPVRKRKRRPIPYVDTEPQERHQESIQAAYHDTDFHDPPRTIEAPRKRRKRPDRSQADHINHYFTEQPVTTTDKKPTRKWGLRKRRPDYDEQMADIIFPMDIEPDEYVNNDKRLENYNNKNKQNYDVYDDIDHTENITMELNSETDDLKNQLNANSEKNKNLPSFQKHDSEEHTQKSIAVADSVSLVSSSEEKEERTDTTIHEISAEQPREKNIENPNKYNSDADIMTMINKPMVEMSKLSIIINGTEQSYLPLKSAEERVIKNLNDVEFVDVAPKIVTDNRKNVIGLEYNSGTWSSSTEVPNGGTNFAHEPTELTYIIFPLSQKKFIVISRNKAKIHNITMIEFDNRGIEKKIILPISKEEAFPIIPEEILNISNEEILSKEEVFTSMPEAVLVDYAMPNETVNISKEKTAPDYKEYVIPKEDTLVDYEMSKETLGDSDYDLLKEDTDPKSEILVYYATPKEDGNPTEKYLAGYASLEGDENKPKERIHDYYSTPSPVEVVTIPQEKPLIDYVTTKEFISSTTEVFNRSCVVKYNKTPATKIGSRLDKWASTNKGISNIKFLVPILSPGDKIEIQFIPEKIEVNGAINPMLLKQLLKRSNGTSLSEILQRHNLSLTDLLQGREEAISAINAGASGEPQQLHDASLESKSQLNGAESKYPTRKTLPREKQLTIGSSSDEETKGSNSNGNIENVESITTTVAPDIGNRETRPRMSIKGRFPTGIRRKLRMRPMLNSTLKAQLSRDLIALSARKYSHNNKNVNKSREWKDIVPMMLDKSKTDGESSKDDVTEYATTTTDAPIETTVPSLEITNSSYSIPGGAETKNVKYIVDENIITTTEATTTIIIEVLPEELTTEAEKPKVTPIVRPSANNSTLRRQAFDNRLKRKRLKQKISTTENPTDDLMRNFLGMANLVSSSQFIERTQKPYTTVKQENTEFATELEDFMTTQAPAIDSVVKSIQVTTTRFSTSSTTKSLPAASRTTTEQSAKFEIEEILNDTMTSERLAKILRERNMTLNELVSHRERGSSHVHLADIFHNASKEPNPPEPFLTKSSIEPISKETYPLRAILEANTHETTTRAQGDQKNYIPVVMDFGNNVNENGESMGIISLFNKLTDGEVDIHKAEIRKDSDGTPYVSSVISVNATNSNDTIRESRGLTDNEDWSELLSFMKGHNLSTFEEDLQTLSKGETEKESIEDLDEDAMMMLEDMQHLQNFENNIASGIDENIEMNIFERRENLSEKPGILNKLPNNTKSVAIVTASILGLAAILFLLTYIAFKWKQQRNKLRKTESFCDVQIPSPVFENRKGHKNNCSSRSISPMISNTNIYMSTLESNGKESPDYMWNSLRKPFQ